MTKSRSENPFAPIDEALKLEAYEDIFAEIERLRVYVAQLERQVRAGVVDALRKAVWG